MKKHINHVALLLDETGSMSTIKMNVMAGVSEFIEGLKADKGDKLLFSLYKFNSEDFTPLYRAVDIAEVGDFDDYRPGMLTPLHDSIVRAIKDVESVQADSVLFAIYTDGLENCSKEATLKDVTDKIEAKKKAGWQFTFLGADIDAYEAGGKLGIDRGATVSTSRGHFANTLRTGGSVIGHWREGNVVAGQTLNLSYSDEEKRQMGENLAERVERLKGKIKELEESTDRNY